jgi:hypothetical protein
LGQTWFEYLLDQALIEFRIRLRESDKLDDGRKSLKASVVFSHLQINQHQVLRRPRQVWGCQVYVTAMRLEDRSLLIVVSSQPAGRAMVDYAQRWSIETLFGIFKTRGFCLESTHLQDPQRLSQLLALLTIALCWALKTGEWLTHQTPIVIKKHGRLAKSIFRTGFDHLRRVLLNLEQRANEFSQVLRFLSCT